MLTNLSSLKLTNLFYTKTNKFMIIISTVKNYTIIGIETETSYDKRDFRKLKACFENDLLSAHNFVSEGNVL